MCPSFVSFNQEVTDKRSVRDTYHKSSVAANPCCFLDSSIAIIVTTVWISPSLQNISTYRLLTKLRAQPILRASANHPRFFLPGKLRESGTWTHILWSIIPGLAFSRSESNTPRKLCSWVLDVMKPFSKQSSKELQDTFATWLYENSPLPKNEDGPLLQLGFCLLNGGGRTSEKHAAA